METQHYLNFDSKNGSFKRSQAYDNADINSPFFLLTFGKMLKEKNINSICNRYAIIYSLKGHGEAFINGEWQTVEEGQAIYFPSSYPKRYRPLNDNDWSTIFFNFYGSSILNTLGDKIFVSSYIAPLLFTNILKQLKENYNRQDFKEFSASLLCYLTLMLKKYAPDSSSNNLSDNYSTIIANSIKYISANFTNDISISEIAEVSGITKEHLCRMFKQETGNTLTSFINSLRLNYACSLIEYYPQRRIEDIARESGFLTLTYFNRVFKEKIGITPSEYRNKNE